MASLKRMKSSEQFLCSICLEVFTDPVTTPCGHNFCKTCITQAWDTGAPCRCPLCNKVYNIRPELKVNTLLSEMVSEFKEEAESSSVPCDVCTDPKLKALKSCLVCQTSFCETHLQPHLTVSGLKKHQLMEPVEDLEDRMCPKHDKPLELFCRSDQSCICIMCPVLEHQSHKFVSLKEEFNQRRSSLQQTQADTQLMVEQRRLKIQEIQDSLEFSQEAVDRERAAGVQAFTDLIKSVQRRQDKFIEELQKKHEQTQKQAQDLISELETEICELQKRGSEVEQLSRSEDHLHFIQKYTSLRPTAGLKDWSTVSFESRTYEGSAARALAELEKTLNEEFKKLASSLQLHRVQQFAVDVTLDPDTAYPQLVLSEDLKQVHHGNVKKDLPETPQRFSVYPCVLGKQIFSSGRFYFEVQVKGKTDWDLGVAQESIDRKNVILNPRNGFWIIWLRNINEYKANDDSPVRLSLQSLLQKVGVFVDYDDGVVSFYDVDTADLLYSFTGCSFKENLYPYFDPCVNDGGKNSSPLIITEVSKK